QIKQGRRLNDADANGRNLSIDWRLHDPSFLHQALASDRKRHISAGNCGCAGSSVCLQHIAIKRDRAFAKHLAIYDRPQAAADQALNFMCAPAGTTAPDLARRSEEHTSELQSLAY